FCHSPHPIAAPHVLFAPQPLEKPEPGSPMVDCRVVGSARTVFANRAIAQCEAAWAFSTVGEWTFAIVLALYAYYEHGPAGVGVAVAARMVPVAVFAGLPGAVRRRWSDRTAVL